MLVFVLLAVDAERGVGYRAQALLGNELTRGTADAVGLVLDAHESGLQLLYELALALGQTRGLLLAESVCTLFKHLEGGRRVGHVVAFVVHERGAQSVVLALCLFYLGKDKLLEFLEFFVGIACFFRHGFVQFRVMSTFTSTSSMARVSTVDEAASTGPDTTASASTWRPI